MFAQIKAACPENSNLQELALCSGESHFDGRRILLQRQFSNWRGEGFSCSSPDLVTKWVSHSHCTLFEVAWLRWHCMRFLCTWLMREEVADWEKGLCKTRHTVWRQKAEHQRMKWSPKSCAQIALNLCSICTGEILKVLTSPSASLTLLSLRAGSVGIRAQMCQRGREMLPRMQPASERASPPWEELTGVLLSCSPSAEGYSGLTA